MIIRLAILSALVTLAGCQAAPNPYGQQPVGAQAADGTDEPDWMKVQDYRNGGPVPPMERDRLVNEQPCTEGVVLTAGNLKCK